MRGQHLVVVVRPIVHLHRSHMLQHAQVAHVATCSSNCYRYLRQAVPQMSYCTLTAFHMLLLESSPPPPSPPPALGGGSLRGGPPAAGTDGAGQLPPNLVMAEVTTYGSTSGGIGVQVGEWRCAGVGWQGQLEQGVSGMRCWVHTQATWPKDTKELSGLPWEALGEGNVVTDKRCTRWCNSA